MQLVTILCVELFSHAQPGTRVPVLPAQETPIQQLKHHSFFFLINLFILCIYFRLHWAFVTARSLSLVAVRRLLTAVASLVSEHGL